MKAYKQIFLLVFLFIGFTNLFSQNLNPGDIAFVEYNADGTDDEFKFVVLVDIPEGTQIKFTDNGVKSDGTFRTGEGIITWTAPTGGVACGTVVTINQGGDNTDIGSTSVSGSFALATGGDQIIAYQGDADPYNFIAAINNEGTDWQDDATSSNTSALPPNLTNGQTAVALDEVDNAIYNSVILDDTKDNLLAAINNKNNWNGDNDVNQTFNDSFNVQDCQCSEPTQNASNISINVIQCDSISISWDNGDGAKRIVVMRLNDQVSWSPTDGQTYTANSTFGAGTDLDGNNTYVVYNGSDNSVNVNGLTGGKTYYIKIFEYNCTAGNEDYLTDGNEPEESILVNPCVVQNLRITCLTNSTATLVWDKPGGDYSGIVLGIREGTNEPHSLASYDAASLTADANFGDGTEYGSTTPYSYVVYKDTGTTLTITGLTKGNDYVVKAYTYLGETGSVWSINNPIKTITDLGVQDVSDPHTVAFDSRIDLSWVNPTLCYDEILVVAAENSSITATPTGDGSSYQADNVFGNGTEIASGEYVVYKGIDPFVQVYGLTNDVSYCFKIFVRKGTDWSDGVEICDTPHEVTELFPGDLIFVGYDTKVGDVDCDDTLELTSSEDAYYILTFVDIKPGTEFGILNASYEYGAEAYERTDEFWSCTSTPGTYYPARINIRWNGTDNIAAGSIIKVLVRGDGNSLDSVYINGNNATDDFVFSGGWVNISETDPDQIWIFQGVIADYGTSPNIYSKLYGKIIYGFSNQADWIDISEAVSQARTSRLHPDLECFNMAFPGDVPVNYYKTTALHIGTKRSLLQSLMDENNWEQASNTQCFDLPDDDIATTTFTILSGNPDGTWIGDADDDWFNCANWESLKVPDKDVDVFIDGNSQKDPVIDVSASAKAPKYDSIAVCKNISISNHTLIFGADNDGDTLDILKVFGDLEISSSGRIDMNTGDSLDGVIYLYGNWNNSVGESAFDEGNGTVKLVGSQLQTLKGKTVENFARLIVDNFSDQIQLLSDITVDSLVQKNAKINLNGYDLTLEGDFYGTSEGFIGNSNSTINVVNSGHLSDFYFSDDQNLYDFNLDRDEKATIRTNLTINNNLNITKGTFVVPPTVFLTVSGDINNSVGSDGLLLESNSLGTASLLHSTTNVEATCQRYMSGGVWHYFFTPLDNAPIDSLTKTSWGGTNGNLYWYDESKNDYWWAHQFCTNIMGWTQISTSIFETDKGYIFYAPETRIHTLKGGSLFAGDKTFTLNYTSSGSGTVEVCDGNNTEIAWDEFDGWNLVGNPYPSAIDWDKVSDFSNMENVIYYYDGASNSYKYYRPPSSDDNIYNHGITVNGGSRYVPPHQGFLVKATADGYLTIPQSARVHYNQQYWKQPTEAPNVVRLAVSDFGYTDETVFQLGKNANMNFDEELDAHKRFAPNDLIPQICSYDSANTFYAINTMPLLEHIEVPLLVYYYRSGENTIYCKANTLENYYVFLEDKEQGKFIEFTSPTAYKFDIESGFNRDRFVLHFNLNHPPKAIVMLNDLYIPINEFFTYTLSEDLFKDEDFWDTTLNISVKIENPQEHSWLQVKDLNFSGTPNKEDVVEVKIFAEDKFGAKDSLEFNIYVLSDEPTQVYSENDFIVYPNPFVDYLNVNLPQDDYKLKIYNSLGQLIYSDILQGTQMIDLSFLPVGIYKVQIEGEKFKFSQKIVKQ